MIETIPDQPIRASGKNESVKLLAGEQQGSVGSGANRMQLTTVDRTPDSTRGCEVQIRSRLSRRQVRRPFARDTSAFPLDFGGGRGLCGAVLVDQNANVRAMPERQCTGLFCRPYSA